MNTLEAIKLHGLSLRQIPLVIISLHSVRPHEEGDEIVENEVTEGPFEYYEHQVEQYGSTNWRLDRENHRVFRRYTRRTSVPSNAGYWMCQKTSNSTGASISWSLKKDHLAPTLEESVALFLKSLEKTESPKKPETPKPAKKVKDIYDPSDWDDEKLRRKIKQEEEMRSLALRDGDSKDAEKRSARIKRWRQALCHRTTPQTSTP